MGEAIITSMFLFSVISVFSVAQCSFSDERTGSIITI
jgi:hypothetical protein